MVWEMRRCGPRLAQFHKHHPQASTKFSTATCLCESTACDDRLGSGTGLPGRRGPPDPTGHGECTQSAPGYFAAALIFLVPDICAAWSVISDHGPCLRCSPAAWDGLNAMGMNPVASHWSTLVRPRSFGRSVTLLDWRQRS